MCSSDLRVEAATLSAAPAASALAAGPADDSSARLERLIQTLPEMARAVVTLFYYEDRSVADVAAALEIPEGTVKVRLHRARMMLQKLLVPYLKQNVAPARKGFLGGMFQ